MVKPSQELFFRVSANLQKLIGKELVSNDSAAFIELVKNAYDSGAKNLSIEFDLNSKKIVLQDDGSGMDRPEFEDKFMFAAHSERSDARSAGRVATGEKGIGRFAADRLGKKLKVMTAQVGSSKALEVEFDWTKFSNRNDLFQDIGSPYREIKKPFQTGTRLEITGLRSQWDTVRVAEIRSALIVLFDPFFEGFDFAVELIVKGHKSYIEIIKPQRPLSADYELQFKITKDQRILRRFRGPGDASISDWKPVVKTKRLGNLSDLGGRLLYYIKRPSRLAVTGLMSGVQLYRDGFLMQPFGSPLSDRLGLLQKRAKRAGHAPLVPNRLFGFVEISRSKHPGLKDTTSRQAMLETDDMIDLIGVLKYQTGFLEENIHEQVSKPKWRESARVRAYEHLKSVGNLSVGIGHEIRQPMQRISACTDAISTRLSEIGVNDRDVSDLLLKIDGAVDRVDKTIEFVKKLAVGDVHEISGFNLAETVRQECRFYEVDTLGIKVTRQIPEKQVAITNETTVIRVLANVLRNAVEAIRDVLSEHPGEIVVTVDKSAGKHRVTVQDNGIGMTSSQRESLFKEFSSGKTGGLGYGLAHSRDILDLQKGTIQCSSKLNVGTTFTIIFPDREISE